MRKTYLDGMTLDEKVKYLDETVANFEANGIQGTPGQDGADGVDGKPGAPGAQGPQGLMGPAGAQGPQGLPGTGGGGSGPDFTPDIVRINADLTQIKADLAQVGNTPADIATINTSLNSLIAKVNGIISGGIVRGHFTDMAALNAVSSPNANDLAFVVDPSDSTKYIEYIYEGSSWIATGGAKTGATTTAPAAVSLKIAKWKKHPLITFYEDPAIPVGKKNKNTPKFLAPDGKEYKITELHNIHMTTESLFKQLFTPDTGTRYRIVLKQEIGGNVGKQFYISLDSAYSTVNANTSGVKDHFVKVLAYTHENQLWTVGGQENLNLEFVGIQANRDALVGLTTKAGVATAIQSLWLSLVQAKFTDDPDFYTLTFELQILEMAGV